MGFVLIKIFGSLRFICCFFVKDLLESVVKCLKQQKRNWNARDLKLTRNLISHCLISEVFHWKCFSLYVRFSRILLRLAKRDYNRLFSCFFIFHFYFISCIKFVFFLFSIRVISQRSIKYLFYYFLKVFQFEEKHQIERRWNCDKNQFS